MRNRKLFSILAARCPSCHTGSIMKGLFTLNSTCRECGYNFHPENGFYLGAMALSYLLTAILTIPPVIILKLKGAEPEVLIAFPLIEFLFLGTFLTFYSRILWLHFEYGMTQKIDKSK